MNKLTFKSIEMRKLILIDVARAYLSHPEPLTKQELQAFCKNITLTPSWLYRLQQAGVLNCQGRRGAKYTCLVSPTTILSNIDRYVRLMQDNKLAIATTVTKRKATYEELLAVIKRQKQEINLLKSKKLQLLFCLSSLLSA